MKDYFRALITTGENILGLVCIMGQYHNNMLLSSCFFFFFLLLLNAIIVVHNILASLWYLT